MHVQEKRPEIKTNAIYGAFHHFRKNLPTDVYRPARGVYKSIKFKETSPIGPQKLNQTSQPVCDSPVADSKIKEKEFYEAFAEWLIEFEGCTKAMPLGGNCFGDKWGTPDVVGVRKSAPDDILRTPEVIVAAEIKVASVSLITAFGQACAYKLFSHKSYIVIPKASSKDDVERLDALARIFGIGLVLFDAASPTVPDFSIRVRATTHAPDMFFANEKMKSVKELFV